jgi:hypothetical protein
MTLIEIRPPKRGWCVFQAPGVEPCFRRSASRVSLRPFISFCVCSVEVKRSTIRVSVKYWKFERLAGGAGN